MSTLSEIRTAQLSPLRVGRITGSRIPKIFNISPYGDRASVMREMVREHFGAPSEFLGNFITDYGHEHEPHAIADYENCFGTHVDKAGDDQQLFIHPEIDFLAGTPDGLIGDDGLVEAKAPWKAAYSHISQRLDYQMQIRLLLEATGRQWADFVVWRPDGIAVSRVEHDPWWLEGVLPTLEEFHAEYLTIIANPDLAAPHLDELPTERTDLEWVEAASEYLEMQIAFNLAKAEMDSIKERLVKLREAAPEGTPARGGGVLLVRSEKSGSVAYAKAVKELLPGADLSAYKGEKSVVYSIRQAS
jgi:hypothetical protein